MTQPADGLPILDPPVTVSNPVRSISVETTNGYATHVSLTPAALSGTEAELAAKIVEVARFSRDRDQANRADRMVAEQVAAGDNEQACRINLHRVNNLPTQAQVDEAYHAHYRAQDGAPTDE